eukprot:jgi/Mesen1/4324/ME000022S03608
MASAREGDGEQKKLTAQGIARNLQHKFNEAGENRSQWRKQLGENLERKEIHIFLIVLLLIDLAAVIYDVLETIHSKAEDVNQLKSLLALCYNDKAACAAFHPSTTSPVSFYISITILLIFLVNVILLLLAWGWTFFLHFGYVLDFVVVVVAIALEFCADEEAAGIIAIATLWRIVRVMHGIFEVTDEKFEAELKEVEERVDRLEELHKADVGKLRALQTVQLLHRN